MIDFRPFVMRFWFPASLTIVLLALSWPGGMTNDAFGWLERARAGIFSDVQPVGPTMLWWVLDKIYPGPFSFIVFNLVLLVFSADLLLMRLIRSAWTARACLVLFIGFPSVLIILGMVYRDVTGLGFTLLTFILTIACLEKNGGWKWLIALTALTYASAMFRDNHAAGAYPFLLIFAWHFLSSIRNYLYRFIVSGLAAFVFGAVLTLAAMTTKEAFSYQPSFISQTRNNYFLARISAETRTNLFPKELYPDVTLEDIDKWLSEKRPYYTIFWKGYADNANPLLRRLSEETENDILTHALKTAIVEYPLVYLRVRARDIINTASYSGNYRGGLRPYGLPATYLDKKHAVKLNFVIEKPVWSARALDAIKDLAQLRLMNNPLYVLTLAGFLSLLSFFLLRDDYKLAVILSFASGALHYLGVVTFAFHLVFYYVHQSIAMGWLAILLFAVGCFRARVRITRPQQEQTVGALAAAA